MNNNANTNYNYDGDLASFINSYQKDLGLAVQQPLSQTVIDAETSVRSAESVSKEPDEEVVTPTNNNADASTKRRIDIEEPQPFVPIVSETLVNSAELGTIINELFNSVFVDFVECNLQINTIHNTPGLPSSCIPEIGCILRFKYMTSSEIKKVPNYEKMAVAVDHVVNQVVKGRNPILDTVNRFNIATGASNVNLRSGGNFAILTNEAKEFLEDYVLTEYGKKPNWKLIARPCKTATTTVNGQRAEVVLLDVHVDLKKLLGLIYNGTAISPEYKKRKNFVYDIHFSSGCNGTSFITRITRIDRAKLASVATAMAGAASVVNISPFNYGNYPVMGMNGYIGG